MISEALKSVRAEKHQVTQDLGFISSEIMSLRRRKEILLERLADLESQEKDLWLMENPREPGKPRKPQKSKSQTRKNSDLLAKLSPEELQALLKEKNLI